MSSSFHPVPYDSSRLRRFVYLLTIAVTAGVLLAGILNVRPLQSANDRSRWATVWALVDSDHGTYRIDEIIRRPGWDTIDKVRHEGHFYSSKPPLLATLVAGVYWGVQKTTGWTLLDNTAEAGRTVLILVNLLPMLLALGVVALMVERYARTDAARVFIVMAAALATFLTTFAMTLNNHTVAAVSLIFALYPAMRIVIDGSERPLLFVLAGFFAALTCTNELPAALFGLGLFGLLCWKSPRRTLLFFVPAALLPLAAYFLTTWLATGGWKPFYMYYGTEKYEYVHEGIPSYWMNPKGMDRAVDSPLAYLLHCTVGHHGIFSLTPIFLLTAVAWGLAVRDAVTGRRSVEPGLRPFVWMGLLLTLAVLGFYLLRTENYNYGGNTAGLRWMFWLIPFWLVSMIPVLDTWGDRRWFRWTAAGLLGVSVFSALWPLDNPWQQPWLFRWMERQGWLTQYREPPPPPFDRPLTTWFASLPPTDDAAEPPWAEFTRAELDGGMTRLRLTAAGREEFEGRTLFRLQVDWNRGRDDARRATYFLDVEAFEAGELAANVLRYPHGTPSPEEWTEAAEFLTGLPRPARYREGPVRYLRTGLRRNAFETQQARASVAYQPPGSGRPLLYQSDVWLSPEVPFGVLAVETTVAPPRGGTVLTRQRMTLSATSGQ